MSTKLNGNYVNLLFWSYNNAGTPNFAFHNDMIYVFIYVYVICSYYKKHYLIAALIYCRKYSYEMSVYLKCLKVLILTWNIFKKKFSFSLTSRKN